MHSFIQNEIYTGYVISKFKEVFFGFSRLQTEKSHHIKLKLIHKFYTMPAFSWNGIAVTRKRMSWKYSKRDFVVSAELTVSSVVPACKQ